MSATVRDPAAVASAIVDHIQSFGGIPDTDGYREECIKMVAPLLEDWQAEHVEAFDADVVRHGSLFECQRRRPV